MNQIRERPPQLGIVFLQGLDLLRVHPIAVGVDRYLVQIVGTPPLEGNKLLDGGEVNMEDVPIERHFSDIGDHIADARLVHALPDVLQFVGPHPHIDGHVPDTLFSGHAYLSPRSGASRLCGAGDCRSPACSAASRICWAIGRLTSRTP